jgi:hypothetical protein
MLLTALQLSVHNAHLRSKCSGRLPSRAGPWGGLFHHLIDLLKSKTLGLRNKKVGVNSGACAQSTPDEEDLGTEVTILLPDEVRTDNCKDAVPEPVGGSGQGNTTGSDWQREDLTNKNPGTRTPSCGKEEDVDADECNLGGDSRVVVEFLSSGSDTNDGSNKLANQHAQGSPDENCTTAESLNDVEGDRSRADIDQSGNETDEEGIGNRAQGLEEGGTEVEDEVDTGPLLHHLEGCSEDGSAQVG